MNKKTEILAPAGSPDALRAAVLCGADAVYFGVKEMNARRSAANFDYDEMDEAVRFCRLRGVKTYLTLNTLVSDGEIKTVYKIIERACAAGIDALILQDLAAVKIASAAAPGMALHASTQMSVQTLEGIKNLQELGFKRAVLPRELSKSETEYLCKNSPIELEAFVHGALCMSVSGQCLMSAVLGSRSGNRGACAQPCRLPFSAGAKGRCDLSLKDLSLLSHAKELSDMGVLSFKIEGRMKRPEYVAAAVTACRQALDGEIEEELKKDLQSIFSRTGFTDGYYTSSLGSDMFGTRRKEDVVSAAPILKKLETLYNKETPRTPISFFFTAYEGEKASLSAKCGKISVFYESEHEVQKALNKPLTADSVKTQLSKTGGTAFFAEDIECDIDDGVNVPVSVINALRRDVLSAAEEKLSAPNIKKCNEINFEYKRHRAFAPYLVCRFKTEEQIPDDLGSVKEIILPADSIKTRFDSSAQLPRGIFGGYEKISKKLADLKSRGVKKVWAGGLDGIAAAKANGLDFAAGFGTNIFNTLSAEEYKNLGAKKILLSPELTLSQIKDIGGDIPRGIFAYGRLPLMLTRNCPQKNVKSCAECKKHGRLVDRKDVTFPIECDGTCSEILNSRPIYMADRLGEIKNADFLLLYFTDESKEEAQKIINAYKIGKKPDGEFTRGLLYRGVE